MSKFLDNLSGKALDQMADRVTNYEAIREGMGGIALPSLALQWLFDANVFLVRTIYCLAGQPRSLKSAFLFELMRLHLANQFPAVLLETEGKISPTLVGSLLGDAAGQIEIIKCMSLEQAEAAITLCVQLAAKKPEVSKGLIIGLDSLQGRVSDETSSKLRKEGHIGRSFSVEALSLSKFWPAASAMLEKTEASLVYTSHLSVAGQDYRGNTIYNTPGGMKKGYMQAQELRFKRVGGEKFSSRSGRASIHIEIKNYKNSYGADGRSMLAFLDYTPDSDSPNQQRSSFNWARSDGHLLLDLYTRFGIADILQMKRSSDERKLKSERLGIATFVDPEEVGRKLQENKEVAEEVRRALTIKEYQVFSGEDG